MAPKKNQVRNKKAKEKEKEKEKKDDKKEEQYFEDNIVVDETTTKDFEFLSNALVSEDDHFVFKSEKEWNVDVSKYSEFFTLDLKTLSAAIESIPFNENVEIDKKYFTDDQLTNIYNNAEQGKEKYKKILSSLEATGSSDTKDKDESQDSTEDAADDLEFLLSLQEPVKDSSMVAKSLPPPYTTDLKIAAKPSTSAKPLDLEKWLDSVLDD